MIKKLIRVVIRNYRMIYKSKQQADRKKIDNTID